MLWGFSDLSPGFGELGLSGHILGESLMWVVRAGIGTPNLVLVLPCLSFPCG